MGLFLPLVVFMLSPFAFAFRCLCLLFRFGGFACFVLDGLFDVSSF